MLKITAYSSNISYAPGERVDVKVSATGISFFDAELRRIIQGDINPEGPGYQDELIATNLGGPFPAREQKIHTGSYGVVEYDANRSVTGSITIATLIWPTLPAATEQTIMSIHEDDSCLRLSLDEEGKTTLELIQAGKVIARVRSAKKVRSKAWYAVIGRIDFENGEAAVEQIALQRFPGINDSGVERAPFGGLKQISWSEVILAAWKAQNGQFGRHFNGRIEAPLIAAGLPDGGAILTHLRGDGALNGIIDEWDFSQGMMHDTFAGRDAGTPGGRLFNLPHRAIAGSKWDGTSFRWDEHPDHYAAVHFHDDDLYDAGWQTDFTVELPHDLKSGVYAIRLFSDEDHSEYYVVFAVRSASGRKKSPIVFVMPTASYMAYANHRLGLDVSETEIGAGQLLQIDEHHCFLQEHPEYGLSLYEVHSDGSGVFYSSRLRPILDFQPKVQGFIGGLGSNVWQFNADTHILGFLENRGFDYDVITDEDIENAGAAALTDYRIVITGSHPEYTSTRMLDAYNDYAVQGGRIMYLGGNGFYWRIAYSGNFPGVIECRRSETGIRGWEPGVGNYYHQFTGELGGLWRRLGRAPQQIFGVGMTAQGFDLSSPYIKTEEANNPRAAFIFDEVNADEFGKFGLNGGAAAGNEIDRADFSLGTPPHALIVASSHKHTDIYLMTPEDLLDPTPTWSGTQCDLIRADMTFFETDAGGAVFSTGSIAWAASMAWNKYDNDTAKITENVILRFADPRPF